jgi:hypothetical protein
LRGRASLRSPVGALVRVSVGGHSLSRSVNGGGSFLSQNGAGLVIGLGGTSQADLVEVWWPSGSYESHRDLAAGVPWLLAEGEPPCGARTPRAKSARPANAGSGSP